MPRIGLDLPTLLQAAVEIADTEGFEAVTLASLAKKLKIRPPSLYNHISGLKELRGMLAAYALKQLHRKLKSATEGKSGDPAVHAMSTAYAAFARAHPGLYESTLRAPDPGDAEVQRIGDQLVELILGILGEYGLEGDRALHAVRGLRSIMHGFASLEKIGGFGLPLDLDVTLRLLVDTYLAGIHIMKWGGECEISEDKGNG